VTGRDAADSDRLAEAIKGITAAPDHLDRLEGPDLAARHREACVAELGAPLPEQGWGLEAVIRTLSEFIVPNGLRNGTPGFSGWVTTSPTTSWDRDKAGPPADCASWVHAKRHPSSWTNPMMTFPLADPLTEDRGRWLSHCSRQPRMVGSLLERTLGGAPRFGSRPRPSAVRRDWRGPTAVRA
jgi:hypothetical protein